MLNKKGVSVWISAILYFGIGIVILTLVLTLGMPVVDRIRDKNIAVQTKDIFFGVDKTIRNVAREGAGSQRVITVELKKGIIDLEQKEDQIKWSYETEAILSEPGTSLKEGKINMFTEETTTVDLYKLEYWLDYSCTLDLKFADGLTTLSGTSELVITNSGAVTYGDQGTPACNSCQEILNKPEDWCQSNTKPKMTQITIKEV